MREHIAIVAAVLSFSYLAEPASPDTRTQVYGPYTRYELTLARAFRDGQDVVLHLGASDGRGVVHHHAAARAAQPQPPEREPLRFLSSQAAAHLDHF